VNELRITFAGQTYAFEPGQTVSIGRSPASAIVVPDPVVSREHARIRWQGDGWVLDDLGKGRTFVGGLPVGSVVVQHPLDVRLASPLGPALLIELADYDYPSAPGAAGQVAVGARDSSASSVAGQEARAGPDELADAIGWGDLTGLVGHPDHGGNANLAGLLGPAAGATALTARPAKPGQVRHSSAIHRSRLWRGEVSASHNSPAYDQFQPHHARAESPGGDFATAVHILIPIRSWLKDPGWKQGSRLLVIAYGLLPSLFVVLFSATTDRSAPGWAYSLAIAPLWAVAFWVLIRPGHITKLIAWLAVGIVAGVMVMLPTVTVPWENALDNTASPHNVLPWIYGVGVAEEVSKAFPILVAALMLRWIWKTTLDVRVWMFLGTIAGLAFGVRESVLYTSNYLTQGLKGGLAIPLILTFAQRVFVDGFQHAVWAGIAAFFIGMGVNYRRRRIPLILFGITLPAVLHGLNDWSTQLYSHWLWIVIEAVSLLLFIGYTMSAATIERQVRDTPLFRGESMIMDKAAIKDNPAES
jgi:RsiW-degrading membrane proteinase PrsW (M82 family)